MSTYSELKNYSRRKLNGKYGLTIGVTLTIFLCNIVLSYVVEWIVAPKNPLSLAAFEIVVFLVSLLLGMLMSGRTYLYMNILYDREASFGDLKQGFIEHPEKALMLQIPFALAGMLATAPLHVYQLFYMGSLNRDVLFYCLVLAFAGFVAEAALDLVFSQVYFLLHDFPDRSVTELFAASAKLMQGHIGQYFLLFLSYLPWLMASAFLFFIPAPFIISQIYAAQAAFYQALTGSRTTGGTSRSNTAPWQPYSY